MTVHPTTDTKRTLEQAVEERTWLTLRYLRRLIYEHRIPSYKLGGRVLVDLQELDAFIETNRVPAAS